MTPLCRLRCLPFFEKQQQCRPKTNLGPAQRRALQALRTDPDIIVKPSDKNLGLCILDKADYEALLLKELNDFEQFKLVLDPAEQITRALVTRFKGILSLWRRDLPAHVFRYFEHWAEQAHLFPHPYVLPKLHKLPEVTREQLPNLKGRLIVPSHSWVTYAASVWLADVLRLRLRLHHGPSKGAPVRSQPRLHGQKYWNLVHQK